MFADTVQRLADNYADATASLFQPREGCAQARVEAKQWGKKNPPFPFSGGVKKPRQKEPTLLDVRDFTRSLPATWARAFQWRKNTPPDEPTLLDASGVDQKTRGEKTLSLLQLPQQKPFTLIRRCIV